jgi:hypothetical protein
MFSFLSPLSSVFSIVSTAPGLFIGVAIGVFGYRYALIKNPNLLNTLVSKATTDIADIEALLGKKKAVLPTAVAPSVPVAVAPAVVDPVPVPTPVVTAPTPVPVAPVVAVPVVAAIPVSAPAAPTA